MLGLVETTSATYTEAFSIPKTICLPRNIVLLVPTCQSHVAPCVRVLIQKVTARVKKERVCNAGKRKPKEEEKYNRVVAQEVLSEHEHEPRARPFACRFFGNVTSTFNSKVWQDKHDCKAERNTVVERWSGTFSVSDVEARQQSRKKQWRKRGYNL